MNRSVSQEHALKALGRRDFLRLSRAGIFVLFPAHWLEEASARQARARPGYPSDFNAYLKIGPDGRVSCFVGKVEMGQGSMTALAQLLADELEVAFESVDMTMGDTDLCPWDGGTFGSQSIRIFGPVLRAAAAEGRSVLLQMAAERLQVVGERLRVESGMVSDINDSHKRVSYAELAKGQRIERHLIKKPEPKEAPALKAIGKSVPRKDALAKVTGQAKYAGDIRLSRMLYASLLRPPAHGAKLKSVDTSVAESHAGARVVRDGDLIAVLHESPDLAAQVLQEIRADWEIPPGSLDEWSIFDHLVKSAPQGQTVHEAGDLKQGEKLAQKVFEETYLNGYVAHASIETHTALAQLQGGKYTLWISTQAPFSVRNQVAQALSVEPETVRVITPFVGGGFGGKTPARQAIEAARLARLSGRPVQVCWSREEEFFYDTFRPAALVKIRAGLGADARIVLWDFGVYCAGDREARQFYDVPHQRTVSHGGWSSSTPGLHPFATGPWRAPAVNTNTFARESLVDAMAAHAGVDPLEFRMKNLSDSRMKRVLRAAAEKFGWTPSKAPSRRGFGIACAIYLGTYVAMMAEVSVNKSSGQVRVQRICCAQEMGLIVNPEGARLQIEGCCTMGLGYALTEEVRFRGGLVLEKNFDSYQLPRFSWVPRIDVVLINDPEQPSAGCGEPAIVCMGAAIANAVFDATGARLKWLPMTPEKVKAALA